jgi:hypothetical protein
MDTAVNATGAAPTLAQRDPQVSLALQALSSRTGLVAVGASAAAAR